MSPILLLDGDLILYRNSIACEREVKWDDENWLLYANEENVYGSVHTTIERLKVALKSERVILCFSSGRSFRYDLCPTYKFNREGQRKPVCYAAVKARLECAYETKSFPKLEADDVLGILSTKPGKAPRILVSDDKDMKTIPGLLYRQGELQKVSELDADYSHLYQTLIGDTADGYPGLPGCGPVTAQKILNTALFPQDNWIAVVTAFKAKGLTEDDALLQARLARICRWSDWDSEKQEVILWTPLKGKSSSTPA